MRWIRRQWWGPNTWMLAAPPGAGGRALFYHFVVSVLFACPPEGRIMGARLDWHGRTILVYSHQIKRQPTTACACEQARVDKKNACSAVSSCLFPPSLSPSSGCITTNPGRCHANVMCTSVRGHRHPSCSLALLFAFISAALGLVLGVLMVCC